MTVSILVLLALVAVGLLSLSTVTVRSASQDKLRRAAQENARVSLMMALGDLQRLTGPDQRVTASAGVLDDGASEDNYGPRPHISGVWKGWKWDGKGGAPDYDGRKIDDFLGWLVSHRDRVQAEDPDFALDGPESDAVKLVGEGTVPDSEDHVFGGRVPVAPHNGIEGDYAWVVLDQGQKARVTLPDSEANSMGEHLAEQAAPPVPGFASVTADQRDWSRLTSQGNERLKLITHGQLALSGVDRNSPMFHDLTPWSAGLAVNASEGGLSQDLSLLFDRSALPNEFSKRFLYSNEDAPLVNNPRRFRGANTMPSVDPSWRLLHSHARLHEQVQNVNGTPTISTSVIERPKSGTSAAIALQHPAFHRQQIAPVIAKAQFIFSLGFGASPNQARGQNQPGATKNEKWVIWLVTDPVITLWNPYDVSLSFENGQIDLHRIPLAFQIFRNGISPTTKPTLFANSYLPGDFKGRAKRYYRLNIKPKLDERGRPEDKIVMKPGEHLVFTAHNHVKHYQQQYMLKGVDLRPGWNAPAGMASKKQVGGISSLNLCVNSSGQSSGRLNGTSTRVIPVKGGDRIQIEVSTAHANVDRFLETKNREITAFLKYYIENDGYSSGSTPPLVGGIEIDYGKREEDILGGFDKRDLPTIVVPRGLPPQQGDNYVGTNPPPNVRFKEPFLIASMHLKTQNDSRVPARSWLHNGPANLYASAGLDQVEGDAFHQYEFAWEAMTDWNSTPTVEIDPADRGFGGSGIYAQSGRESAPFASVPLAPLTSLAQLRHAPVNSGGQLPLQAQVIANSFPHPLLRAGQIREDLGDRSYVDHSFLANQSLFDRYFFSSAGAQKGGVFAKSRGTKDVLEEFLAGESRLPNPRMTVLSPPLDPAETANELADDEGYRSIAAHMGIEGAFNVNSTSVAAWQAVLASLQPEKPYNIKTIDGSLGRTGGTGTLVSRHVPVLDEQFDGVTDQLEQEVLTWTGHRRLDDYQIEALAREIVKQVKAARSPAPGARRPCSAHRNTWTAR